MTPTPPSTDTGTLGLIRKILITVVAGAISYTLTASFAAGGDQLLQITVALFVGSVAFVVQYLVSVERRLDQVESSQLMSSDLTRKELALGLKQINDRAELLSLIDSSQVRHELVTDLVRQSTRLNPDSHMVLTFAQAEVARLSQLIKSLADGSEAVYEGEDRDWMLGLAHAAVRSIDSVGLTTVDAGVDGGLWYTDQGQRFLESLRAAVARGVSVRKVFVLQRSGLAEDPEFQTICLWHRSRGVRLRVLDAQSVSSHTMVSLFDFIVFDGSVSYEQQLAGRMGDGKRQVVVDTRMVSRPDKVAERMKHFEELWGLAEEPA